MGKSQIEGERNHNEDKEVHNLGRHGHGGCGACPDGMRPIKLKPVGECVRLIGVRVCVCVGIGVRGGVDSGRR